MSVLIRVKSLSSISISLFVAGAAPAMLAFFLVKQLAIPLPDNWEAEDLLTEATIALLSEVWVFVPLLLSNAALRTFVIAGAVASWPLGYLWEVFAFSSFTNPSVEPMNPGLFIMLTLNVFGLSSGYLFYKITRQA